MLLNILYIIGVILIILGVIGLITGQALGVGIGGLVVGIILVVVARFVVGPRGNV